MISLGLEDGKYYLPGTVRIVASPVLSLTAKQVIEELKEMSIALQLQSSPNLAETLKEKKQTPSRFDKFYVLHFAEGLPDSSEGSGAGGTCTCSVRITEVKSMF